jgi:glycosyltransferase involved in cell wall biosynthesis
LYFAITHKNRNALVILDDLFPWLGTGFRILEFNHHLKTFDHTLIYSTSPEFRRTKRAYSRRYLEYSKRVFRFNSHIRFDCRLFYIVFLHNAYTFLPTIEKYRVPFILELYPGGFFQLDDARSDEQLAQVCRSAFLQKVIVTQRITHSYLLQKTFCPDEKICYIHGGVINTPQILGSKKLFGRDKPTFDICFTAYKVMPMGRDKGYDIFVQVATELGKKDTRFRFHVVGTFDETDIDVSTIREQIRFYGPRTAEFFPEYYLDKDVILSPNRPFVLANGAFDGIPTGAVLEAAACGVAMFCTDQLNLTSGVFEHGKDIVIMEPDAEAIISGILRYFQTVDELYQIARQGKITVERVYGLERQLGARTKLIRDVLEEIPPR